jgi:hypothetical protein
MKCSAEFGCFEVREPEIEVGPFVATLGRQFVLDKFSTRRFLLCLAPPGPLLLPDPPQFSPYLHHLPNSLNQILIHPLPNTAFSSPQARTVRELSIMSARKPPIDMRFVPTAGFPELDQAADRSAPWGPSPGTIALGGGIRDQAADAVLRQPTRCMLLRTDGELSLLDLDRGSERALVAGVEHFWLTGPRAREEELLMEEVPWWAYGHRGMQVRGGGALGRVVVRWAVGGR